MEIKDKIIDELNDLKLPLGTSFEYWVVLLIAIYEHKIEDLYVENCYNYIETCYNYLGEKYNKTY